MKDKRGGEVDGAKAVGTFVEKDDDGAELDGEALESGITLDEDAIDWLERLGTNAPVLSVFLDFVVSSESQEVSITSETFHQGFSWCCQRLGMDTVPAELVEKLFNRAIPDKQMLSAYDAFQEVLRGPRFKKTLQFIQEELTRLEQFTKFLRKPRKFAVPQPMSEWESIWIGSLRELTDTINNQLRSGNERIALLKEWATYGRTDLRSHLLLVTQSFIANLIKRQKPRRSVDKLLVCYAHASQLLSYPDSAKDGDPIENMKNRISGARHSKMSIPMLSIMLAEISKKNQSAKS